MLKTSQQETDSSAHLDKRCGQHHLSSDSLFDLRRCFRKEHGHVLSLLSKKAWSVRRHGFAAWVICQSEVGEISLD